MVENTFSNKFYQGDYWLAPSVAQQDKLTSPIGVVNEKNQDITHPAISEKPLTIFLNSQEIITAMTIGDHPNYLAIGFLVNQKILTSDDAITAVEVDDELGVVVVRTKQPTHFEIKTKKKIVTSGCGQGTVFGDIMDEVDKTKITSDTKISTQQLQNLLKKIALTPSLYLTAGAIHGCALAVGDVPKIYVEDVGRHNAVDKIAGYMWQHGISGHDKIFYTTGRLTSEMVIKCLLMDIPILVSRNGFTLYGAKLARHANMTMVARARGDRFMIVAGKDRILFAK
ncbi:MAG: formate dehydrogenase accessory sulfurtransferase FdhD [Alphaproteobacteria bacterium]